MKPRAVYHLLFTLVAVISCRCQTLTESEPALITPGGSHTLTCTFSGIDPLYQPLEGRLCMSAITAIQPLFIPMQISTCSPNISSISLYSSFHHSKRSTNMFSSASLLLLAAAASYVFCATELIQPDSVLIKPAEPLTISCTVSGASITDSSSHYGTGWIRQPAGKALEWINTIFYEGSIHAKDSLKSKFSISQDTSSNKVTLQGRNLQAEDTAVYYCARSISLYSSFHHSKRSTNMFSSASLLLLAAATYVFCATELIQPDSVLIKPAEPLTITCTVSGASITDRSHYATAWIRQPAGKTLEWITNIYYEWTIYTKDSLKSKFSVSQDTNSNKSSYEFSSAATSTMLLLFLLLLLDVSSNVDCAVELTQTHSVGIKPGESLTLICTLSGYSVTDTNYATVWIRHPAEKTLEWISHIWGGGQSYRTESLKSKFSISKDASSNTVTLQGQNMQPEDTAVYYCVRYTQRHIWPHLRTKT
ncbi:hypothetical protein AOLI_G00175720 [Acnodon oligacanthus]